ncbi:alpha/beta family hydrolase [Microbulbifer sp. 2201CG32-9]|uniref:alpha/beta family hydrolase n=1 Tax=Microbulbifer sp. 2201CG32-9 TaxID=3232309 RepID=UPI00345C35F5
MSTGSNSAVQGEVLLYDRPRGVARARFLFAHGAGAPMDSEFMRVISAGLSAHGVEVWRFEFPYMAARRSGGPRRPPNPMPQLLDSLRGFVERADTSAEGIPLLIGGKSLGGRVASLLADELYAEERIAGLVCFGYPFHPRGKPDQLRTAHLRALNCPTLVLQGSRDPLGSRGEVAGYDLSAALGFRWLEDGDHDFRPRIASGFTQGEHWQKAVEAAAGFMLSVTPVT